MGTPEFAVPALKALLQSHEVVAAYSQPPRPAGRGQMLRKSPIQTLAEEAKIPVFTPTKLIPDQKPPAADIAVVAAYGLLLPEWFLQSFKYGCINIHPSALPRWRGAAPIQRTVLAGDKETAICIMQMEKGLDTGPVLKREILPVPPRITSGELHNLLSEKSAPLLLDVLKNIDSLKPQTQSTEGVTYAKKVEKSEALIDWRKSAAEIDCLVRGLNPFPGAYFEYDYQRIKILAGEPRQAAAPSPAGIVKNNALYVACGEGVYVPYTLQREGKKPAPVEEFLRGFPIPANTKL